MKLGDVFGKLAGVELRTLLKWYGWAVIGCIVLVVAGVFSWLAAVVLWSALSALPWWGIVAIMVIVSGFLALNATMEKDDDYGFFHSSAHNLYGAMHEEPKAQVEKINSKVPVDYVPHLVRQCLDALPPDVGCTITMDQEDYFFDNKEEALAFYNANCTQ